MRDRDGSTDDQRNVEGVHELFTRHAHVSALFDVVSNAIVASQNNRTRQSHQFFRLLVERTIFICLRIQSEKSFDAEMAAAEQLLVHVCTITIKVVHPNSPFLFSAAGLNL